jgi:Uri superfamily endonuclease
MRRGTYQLLIHLSQSTRIKIGRKGAFRFPKGYYIYTGSAKNGLKARVERHLRQEKRRFWHIDYLLEHASIRSVFLFEDEFEECSLAKRVLDMRNAKIIVPGFGASDCKCPAHLVYFERSRDVRFDSTARTSFFGEVKRCPAESIS